jgi:chromosome segregation ATPase
LVAVIARRHRASRRVVHRDPTRPDSTRTSRDLFARAMLARAPSPLADALARRARISHDDDDDDASTTSALESALADARRRARDAAVTIAELEASRDAATVAARRAEARAKSLGERLERALTRDDGGLARDALKERAEALETSNARLREALRETNARADALEAEVKETRRMEAAAETAAGEDAAAAETADRREKEIGRLRRELGRQAQVIADAYRDEMMRLQRDVRESEGKREALEKQNEALRADAAKLKKAAKAAHGPRNTYESPYAYAKYSDKHRERDAVRSPLTPRSANVFDRLATPKRVSTPASPGHFR